MTRRAVTCLMGLGIAVLTATMSAQARPDFSGTWVAVKPAEVAGQKEFVAQDATMLVRGHASESGEHLFMYNLDGSQSRNVIKVNEADVVTLSKTSWSGDRLIIVNSTTYPDGRTLDQTETWSIGKDGRLSIDLSQLVDGKVVPKGTVVYERR
jgi:hypothetical protein